jgi:hypothetical protein
MGILGALEPEAMLDRLEQQAKEYADADPCTPVIPALHVVAVVAQPAPGGDRKYRTRTPDSLIERVARWAQSRNALLFLDIQPGQGGVGAEVQRLEPFLRRPGVHVALDPEFALSGTRAPGDVIGSLSAEDVNDVVDRLARIVAENALPPKVLVVHRFTQAMLSGRERIRLDPRVQIVIDMDGFGAPALKRDAYNAFVGGQLIQFTGFKLFYQLDRPLMTARQVLALKPAPHFILYQ